MYNKLILILLILVGTYGKAFSQDDEGGEIEYDDAYNGGQIEALEFLDTYEKEQFMTDDVITIDLNALLLLDQLIIGEKYTVTLDVVNHANFDVIFRGFSKPCLCVATDWYKQPIPSGGTGFVKITYTAAIVGPHEKRFTAYLFDSNTSKPAVKKQFILKANVANPSQQD